MHSTSADYASEDEYETTAAGVSRRGAAEDATGLLLTRMKLVTVNGT
jgi:hypothetical protein